MSRHHQKIIKKRVVPIFVDVHISSVNLDVAFLISILVYKGHSSQHYTVHATFEVGQWNLINISFYSAIAQQKYEWSFSVLGISFPSSRPR